MKIFLVSCRFLSAVALLATTLRLDAQSPVITPEGDPSVLNDSIYRLAVNPADNPDDAVIYLLNDGVVRLGADGRGTRTYRQVVQILKQQAVASFAERRLGYSPDHEKFTLNWARVIGADGKVISAEPAQMQESDVPASTANPIYVNRKDIRISFGGVAVGTIIDISYTTEETQPFRDGDAYIHWNVHAGATRVLRSRFIYDLPAAVRPRITQSNLDFQPVIAQRDGRRIHTWARHDVPAYRPEPYMPGSSEVQMYVIASLPGRWADIATWYGRLAGDRYTLTPAIEAKVRETVAAARTRTDTLRAVHRWVAQDIRYVSVSLGLGGYQPRTPEQVVTTGFGDCKDKTTLFIAAMRMLGIEAYPVLLHQAGSAVRREHPSIRQFNHVIAAVPEGDGYHFADLTAAFTPFGEVPVPSQGGFAVVVLPEEQSAEVVLPEMEPGSRRVRYDIVAEISEAGLMSGHMEEANSGHGFEARRSAFGVPLDSARRSAVMRGLLAIIPGARGDSLEGFDGRDLYAPVRYRVFFSNARGTASTGGAELFSFPFGVLPASARITSLEGAPARKNPISAERVLRSPPPSSVEVDMRVTLPEGWRARVPESVVVQSDFGIYSTEYSQDGRVLRIVRREASAYGTYPASSFPDVIAFFRAIGADENNRSIIIEKGS